MNSRIECPHCKRSLTVAAKLAGRAGQCPHCSGKFRIPAQAACQNTPPRVSRSEPKQPPPPPAVDTPWMYMHASKITGPVSAMQLSQLCQSGAIAFDCPVFHVPSGRWMQLNNIPGMFAPAYPQTYAGWGVPPR